MAGCPAPGGGGLDGLGKTVGVNPPGTALAEKGRPVLCYTVNMDEVGTRLNTVVIDYPADEILLAGDITQVESEIVNNIVDPRALADAGIADSMSL